MPIEAVPRVSVCISVLNDAAMLRDTLKSVIAQSFDDWEAIVVDDGSANPDEIRGACTIFGDARISYHRFPVNRGIPHGANYSYKLARGEFIQALGVDEQITPDKFEDQVAYLDANPNVALVWGIPGVGPLGRRPEWEQYLTRAHNRSREHWLKCFLNLEGVPVGGASALWRKSLFDSIGYFDENLTAFSDHEWFCRVIAKHEVRILPYRWMTETPGHKTICTRTEKNAAKLDWELAYVREKHPIPVPATDGLITVAVPCYNHAKYLKAAMDALMCQTEQNWECIVIDDGSTDDPASVMAGFTDPRITFIVAEKNDGHMATVNKMLAMAKGEFFVSYSADDTMAPDFLKKCLAEFVKDPFLEYVASQNDFMHEDGTPWNTAPFHPFHGIPKAVNRPQQEWANLFRQGNVYFGIGMYRTSALREVGCWSPEHGVITDYEMYLKLLPRYNFRIIEELLTHTRIHGKNQSLLTQEEARKLKRRYYDAQRPYYQPRPKIIIATPYYEMKGFSPYIQSLDATTKILTMSGIEYELMQLNGDSYVHRARNSMCMNFLDDPYATDLFFIDSDMAWDPNAFMAILFLPHPVVGGAYPVKNKWDLWTSKPIIFDAEKDPHYNGVNLPNGEALIQANQLAGGFLRVKRSVLERFIEFYPTYRYHDTHPDPTLRREQVEFFTAGMDRDQEAGIIRDIEAIMSNGHDPEAFVREMMTLQPRIEALRQTRNFVGEDYTFSNRLRAMGVDLFIYPNATIAHYGVQEWRGNFDQFLKEKSAEAEREKAQLAVVAAANNGAIIPLLPGLPNAPFPKRAA